MNEADHNSLTPSEWRLADDLLVRFETAWREAGTAIVADFIPDANETLRGYVLCELIKLDVEYRVANGDAARVETYLHDYPELGRRLSALSEIVVAEFEVRCDAGESPSVAEFESRFPQLTDLRERLIKYAANAGERPTAKFSIKHYDVREEIGRGAFAIVYRAWDSRLQRDVAIKLARREVMDLEETRRRMLREARAAARLQHPAIVPVYEVGEHDGRVFIVTEFIEGPTLAERISEAPPSYDQAARWTAQCADALEYAHQCNIVHRDVKPANVLLRDEEPVVTDFGLAHQSDSAATLTQQGDILGTPAFMSPEQAGGKTDCIDRRSDIYSLGVVLYQMLCRQLPFQGATTSVLHRVLHEDPTRPSSVRSKVPPELDTICLKAMAKDRKHRYATAANMAEDLRRYLKREPILARPIGPIARLALWCRRRPALAATIAASATLIFAVAGFGYWQVLGEKNRYREERNRAQSNLYRSLLSDARSQLQARDTGWYFSTLEKVEQASQLEVENHDPVELRDLATQVMTTRGPCFRLIDEFTIGNSTIDHLFVVPPGKVVASTSGRVLRFHAINSGEEIAVLPEFSSDLTAIAVHPSGTWMVLADEAGDLHRIDLGHSVRPHHTPASRMQTHKLAWPLGVVEQMRFSPDGRTLALAARGGKIFLSQVGDDQPQVPTRTLIGHQGRAWSVEWSNDGRLLASGGQDRTLRLWNPSTGLAIGVWTSFDPIRQVRFRHDDLAIGFVDRESLGYRMLDLRSNSIQNHTALHSKPVRELIPTPYGWLTASADGTLRVFEKGISRAIARGAFAGVTVAAITGDSETLLAGHQDGVIRKWRLVKSPFVGGPNLGHRARFLTHSRRLIATRGTFDVTNGLSGAGRRFDVPGFTAVANLRTTKRYVCGTSAGELRIFRSSEADPSVEKVAHRESISKVVVGPDDRWILSASSDGTIRQWETNQLTLIREWAPGFGPIHSLTLSPDGRRFAAAGRDGVGLWSSVEKSSPLLTRSHLVQIGTVALGAGTFSYGRLDGTIRVLMTLEKELAGKTTILTKKQLDLRGHQGAISALAMLPDGRLVSAGRDKTLRIWNLETGREELQLRGMNAIANGIACHSNGKLIAVNGDTWIGFWNLPRRDIGTFAAITANLHSDFSTDGQRLIVCGDMGFTAEIPVDRVLSSMHVDKFFTVEDRILVPGGHSQRVWGVAVSPDDRWIATTGHDAKVKIWSVEKLRLMRTLPGHRSLIWCAAFHPDSKVLATGSSGSVEGRSTGEIRIWDVETGREIRRHFGHDGLVRSLAYDPGGRFLASGSNDGSIIIWDTNGGKQILVLARFGQPVHDLSFSNDGKWLVAACDARNVAIWETGQWNRLPALARTDSANRAASASGIPAPRILGGQYGHASAVAISRDCRFLAVGTGRGNVTLWRISDMSRVVTIQTSGSDIRSLSFSEDDAYLAAGSYTGRGTIWNLRAIRDRLKEMRLDW